MLNNDNKVCLITGVGSGIGKCIAERMIKNGIYTFGIDIKNPNISGLIFFEGDISDDIRISNIFAIVRNQINHIDYLINVAGIFSLTLPMLVEETAVDEWRRIIDINLTGTFIITKYAIPLLKTSKDPNVINFSSEQVLRPQKKNPAYVVSKAGIELFTKVCAKDFLEYGIRVNAIALASVRTNFIRHLVENNNELCDIMENTDSNMPFGIIEPESVFDMLWFIIHNGKQITGQIFLIDSGILSNE